MQKRRKNRLGGAEFLQFGLCSIGEDQLGRLVLLLDERRRLFLDIGKKDAMLFLLRGRFGNLHLFKGREGEVCRGEEEEKESGCVFERMIFISSLKSCRSFEWVAMLVEDYFTS